ncbi:BatA domain-containing protein [Christiangramia flava]|uniref:Uncharacterized protein n=1 Tax=Christiangramia flava JLT2011 TaxID=1229726 RepID=A0A1L7I9G4_9FLAO|nr:BatA domain-containing protein [Christiangramia flava]APU69864.1 hypothetical protein GRFL_3140 [Christiangramia flava JLT2011]OSS37820.1 hypothetical protein C723_3289 [Christiangramia flava JLT2011]
MKFEHPELLYALILLAIPLIVHLFRLRRFQKQEFTNVKFLKKVIQETRKSSRLKKILILITRMLLFACLILAFAKPYLPASETAEETVSTLFYLDNSFSNQNIQGKNNAFQLAVNQLYKRAGNSADFSFFTNQDDYYDLGSAELQEALQDVSLTSRTYNLKDLQLKASEFFQSHPADQQHFVLISDLQKNMGDPEELETTAFKTNLIKPENTVIQNISIDSAFIENTNPQQVNLKVLLHSNFMTQEPVSVAVFDGEQLLGRNAIIFKDSLAEVSFRLTNELLEHGFVSIEDDGLTYDNQLFFDLKPNRQIQVVALGNAEDTFLRKIYTEPEFSFQSFQPDQIDFNALTSANLVILNEADLISQSLWANLRKLSEEGASLVFIPSEGTNSVSLFSGNYSEEENTEKLISKINFDHPLFEGVFENRTQNFEYPKTLKNFKIPGNNAILEYENGNSFLRQSANHMYEFAAPLNLKNSNFQNSPLIVPIFYQFGLQSLKPAELYYNLNQKNNISIPLQNQTDAAAHLDNGDFNMIPLQQNVGKRIDLQLTQNDLQAGNYSVTLQDQKISTLSFNYSRKESDLQYLDIAQFKNVTLFDSVQTYLETTNDAREITSLWKWFVIFALIFLALEMLLIKFFK